MATESWIYLRSKRSAVGVFACALAVSGVTLARTTYATTRSSDRRPHSTRIAVSLGPVVEVKGPQPRVRGARSSRGRQRECVQKHCLQPRTTSQLAHSPHPATHPAQLIHIVRQALLKMRFTSIIVVLAALAASSVATPASSLTRRAAEYGNNCKGSGLCSSDIRGDCEKAIGTVNSGLTYTDQAQFSVGHCYMIYATNGAGQQPVSGQTIIDTANTILDNCGSTCGSFGTNNAGCSSCHVTLNYRS